MQPKFQCQICGYVQDHLHCPCSWIPDTRFSGVTNLPEVPAIFKWSIYDDVGIRIPKDIKVIAFFGDVGTGKSHGLWALAKRYSINYKVGIINVPSIPKTPGAAMEWVSENYNEYRDVWCFDDVSGGNEFIYDILNKRLEHNLVSIVTSNVLLTDKRLMDRIIGCGVVIKPEKKWRGNNEEIQKINQMRETDYREWFVWSQNNDFRFKNREPNYAWQQVLKLRTEKVAKSEPESSNATVASSDSTAVDEILNLLDKRKGSEWDIKNIKPKQSNERNAWEL